MTIRDIVVSFGFDVDKRSEKDAEGSIKKLKDLGSKLLGTIAIGFSLVKVNALAEEFNGVNDQIKNATKSLGEQDEIQQKILKSANDTKSSYADTAKMVSNLVQENSDLFGTVDEAVKFNDSATKLFKTAGKSNEQIAGLMESINKSFAKGKVDSETISQLLEQSPEAVKLLNEKLGTTSDKLEEMASGGKISLSVLKEAFVSNADEINKNFDTLDYSISDAVLNIRNQWGLFCDDIWNGSGVANKVGKTMVRAFSSFMDLIKKLQPMIERMFRFLLSSVQKAFNLINRVGTFLGQIINKVGGVENILKLVAIAAGAIWLALNAGKILDFLRGVGTILSGVKLKVLLIVGVIVALALIIDDFINFMKGNDSVIGTLFEKAGIDADAARQTIINAWETVKSFLLGAWAKIKSVAMSVFGAIKSFLSEHGDEIKVALVTAWTVISTVLKGIWNGLKTVVKTAFEAISSAVSIGKDAFDGLVSAVRNASDFIHEHKEAMELLGVALGTITALVLAYKASSIAAAIASGAETAAIYAMYAADGLAAIAKGALTAATGLWSTVAGVATTVTTALGSAVAFLTSPIGLVILAIGALIAIGVLLYNHWDEVKAFAGKLWDGIKAAFSKGVEAVKGFIKGVVSFVSDNWKSLLLLLVNPVAGAFSLLYKNCEGFRNFVDGFMAKVKSAVLKGLNWIKELPARALAWGKKIIDGFLNGIKAAIAKIGEVGRGIGKKIASIFNFSISDDGPLAGIKKWLPDLQSVFDSMGQIVNGFKRVLKGISDFVSSVLKGDWSGAWDAIKEIFRGVWNVISGLVSYYVALLKNAFSAGVSFLKSMWESAWSAIKSFFEGIWNGIVSFATEVWNTITSVISGAVNSAHETIVSIFSAIRDFISDIVSGIKDTVSTTFENIISSISSTVGRVKEVVVSGFTKAIDWIKGLPSQALTWGSDIVTGIADGIKGAVGKVTDAVKGIAEKIKSFLHFSVPDEGPLTDFESWMPDFMGGLAKGIKTHKGVVIDQVKELASGISALKQAATAKAQTVSNSTVNNASTHVTQNNVFNNSYSGGERQAQKNISKGMNRSAGDATKELAKGLAYLR